MLNSVDPFELMLILSKVTIYGVPFIKYIEGGINYREDVVYLNKLIPNYTYLKIGSPFFSNGIVSHTVYIKRSAKGYENINIGPITLKYSDSLIAVEKIFATIAKYIERRQYAIR